MGGKKKKERESQRRKCINTDLGLGERRVISTVLPLHTRNTVGRIGIQHRGACVCACVQYFSLIAWDLQPLTTDTICVWSDVSERLSPQNYIIEKYTPAIFWTKFIGLTVGVSWMR